MSLFKRIGKKRIKFRASRVMFYCVAVWGIGAIFHDLIFDGGYFIVSAAALLALWYWGSIAYHIWETKRLEVENR